MTEAALVVALALTVANGWDVWQQWAVTLVAVVLAGAAGRALAAGPGTE